MNIYMDFEANTIPHFEEIISIGAVAPNGETFYSLVRPHHNLDRQVKKLTGITQQEVDASEDFDTVIVKFDEWLQKFDSEKTFLVYGDQDKKYLRRSLLETDNCAVRDLTENIILRTERVDKKIARSFGKKAISLRNAYALTFDNPYYDAPHNALGDAMMLKEVYEHVS